MAAFLRIILSQAYLKQVVIMGCVLFVLVGPYGIAMLCSAFSGHVDISSPVQSSLSQSADLLSFFVPSFMHPIFGPIVRPFYDHITTYGGYRLGGYIEVTAYVGFATIFLVIFALRHMRLSRLRFWIFIAAFFFVLTLGPALKVGGLVQIPAEWVHLDKIAQRIEPDLDPLALEMMKNSVGIPLPYLIWHFIPLLSGSESAGRLDIMFVLAWAVLCGFGVRSLIEKIRKRDLLAKAGYRIVCLCLLFLILFEYAPFPIKMTECPVSTFYKGLADDPDDYALIDLPILNTKSDIDPRTQVNELLFSGFYNLSSTTSMYKQTVHHKKIVNGMTCRLYPGLRDFIDNTLIIRLLVYPEEIRENKFDVDVESLKRHKIKYIVLHRNYLTEGEFRTLVAFLEDKFKRVFNDQEIVAYQTYH